MQRLSKLLAFPILLLSSAGVLPSQDPLPLPITVNVDLVVLHATVKDRRGALVSDLRGQDFEIYEEGVRQTIQLFRHEDIPVTVGLVVDHSGSMRPKMADVTAAAKTFIEASSPKDEMFVVNFNENVTMGLPKDVRFSDRPDELARAILNAPATGQTALYDAVLEAERRCETGQRDKKALIVISDGGDNASRHGLEELLTVAGQSTTLIYTIGIFDDVNQDRNPAVLRRLAAATGGEAYFPTVPGEAVAICERIARDIRHQYTLGYSPSHESRAGAYRPVQVLAHGAGRTKLSVRARTGYIAPGAPAPPKNEFAK